jgi:hypothetical protein
MANAKELYSHYVRKQWQKIQGTQYRYKMLLGEYLVASPLNPKYNYLVEFFVVRLEIVVLVVGRSVFVFAKANGII